MQLRSAFMLILCPAQAVFAQIPETELRSKITYVHYAPLAEMARVQGDVHLKLKSGVVTVLSGHPLLAPIAVESAKSFGSIQVNPTVEITYHFVVVDATEVTTPVSVKRGMRSQGLFCGCLDSKLKRWSSNTSVKKPSLQRTI